jgi:hypothetical protein
MNEDSKGPVTGAANKHTAGGGTSNVDADERLLREPARHGHDLECYLGRQRGVRGS